MGQHNAPRAFVILHHERYGYLLLQAHKKSKGLHYQLPGGHVDQEELARLPLEEACLTAAAREVFEETGIDFRPHLSRLSLCVFANGQHAYKDRYYFRAELEDRDLTNLGQSGADLGGPLVAAATGQPVMLKLSAEHVGFGFVDSVLQAAGAVTQHSGGKNTEAMRALHACGQL